MIFSTCFEHLYAHHRELTIIYHSSPPHGMSASWVLTVVRCGMVGYVAGLAATAVATRHFIWDLWWTKRHLDGLFFESIIAAELLVSFTYHPLEAAVHKYIYSLNY
jgi:hypothetical protein